MIEICTSGYRGKSVLCALNKPTIKTYCTEFTDGTGVTYGGELDAESMEEAELVARALGVEVVGRLISEIKLEMDEFGNYRETDDGTTEV